MHPQTIANSTITHIVEHVVHLTIHIYELEKGKSHDKYLNQSKCG